MSTLLWLLAQISVPILAGIGLNSRNRGLAITLAWSAVPIVWILVALYRDGFAVEDGDPSRTFLTGFIIAVAIYLVIANLLCWKLGRWIRGHTRVRFRERDGIAESIGRANSEEPGEFPLDESAISQVVDESSQIERPPLNTRNSELVEPTVQTMR